MTPLHKACQYGHVRAVEELIHEEADVLAVNDWNSTSLHWLVKGFVHNQKEKAYNKEDYLAIASLLILQSKRLLDKEDSVGTQTNSKGTLSRATTRLPSEPLQPTQDGRTPIDLARDLEATDLVLLLDKKMMLVRSERVKAAEKREFNKPKVRRI